MSLTNRLCVVVACMSLAWLTGCTCTGPLACSGNGACCTDGTCGPLGTACGGCGACEGCGELYIDPWINHPPDCCDPCDRCGNYNGQSCGKCRSVFFGVASLWGYRCGDTGCNECENAGCTGGCGVSDGCCDSCDGGCDSCCGSGLATSGEVYESDGQVVRMVEPTPARQIIGPAPSESHYVPHRSRRIFRARPEVAEGEIESIEY